MRGHERITLKMTTLDALFAMSDGNPGCCVACAEILRVGHIIDPDGFAGGLGAILMLDTLGIYGARIYMLWNDVCQRNVSKVLAVLRAYQLGQLAGVTRHALDHAIDNQGQGLDLDAILLAVMERLPQFQIIEPEIARQVEQLDA